MPHLEHTHTRCFIHVHLKILYTVHRSNRFMCAVQVALRPTTCKNTTKKKDEINFF